MNTANRYYVIHLVVVRNAFRLMSNKRIMFDEEEMKEHFKRSVNLRG